MIPGTDLSESEWDGQLFRARDALTKMLGWTSYHTLRSKGSASGFPDRVLWRERVVYAELKSETGKPTEKQIEVISGLAKAGAEVYLWRPSDLDEIALVLRRQRWIGNSYLLSPDGQTPWRPFSLWLPSGSRVDAA